MAQRVQTHIERTFIGSFSPRGYLNEYYSVVDHENDTLLKFYAAIYKTIPPHAVMLDFGGGPTIYALISAARYVGEIYVCDYLEANLHEINRWVMNQPDAFNWNPFIKRALEIESNASVTPTATKQRRELIRRKLKGISQCNAFRDPPLTKTFPSHFDIVQTNFVAESITSSLSMWEQAVKHIASLVRPHGLLIMTALKNASYYHLGEKRFPAVSIDEEEICKVLPKLGFPRSQLTIQTAAANPPYRGYEGFLFITGKKESH